MKKNYYDILQINMNASPEIVEKAYKTLAKKYHPDLQPENKKKEAESILKEINEAYEILSDSERKKAYDLELKKLQELEEQKKFEDYKKTYSSEQSSYNTHQNTSTQNFDSTNQENSFYTPQQQTTLNKKKQDYEEQLRQQKLEAEELKNKINYERQMEYARQKAYHDAYIQDLKNRGYKIRYKKSFKDYVKGLISISLVVLILFLLWQIPFVQNYFIELYQKNEVIHFIGDLFKNKF